MSEVDLGVKIGGSQVYEGFPVELRKTKNRGRIMVATRDIKAGQPAMRVMHYTTNVSEDFAARVCSTCSKEHDHSLDVICHKCTQVRFCDEKCMAAAEHFHEECQALARLHTPQPGAPSLDFSIDEWSEIRMIVKMLAKRNLERRHQGAPQHHQTVRHLSAGAAGIYQPVWEDVCMLTPNVEHFDEATKERIRLMTEHVFHIMPSLDRKDEDVSLTFYRERCNCFGIWNKHDHCLASAIFPTASFLNHSCAPNCSRATDETGLISITALYDIPAGTEITISYIDVKNRTTESRRPELSGYYRFTCGCARCEDTTDASDRFMEKYLCQREGCTGMLLPQPQGGAACRICEYKRT
jgi:SET and MYND domain-containing protein